MTSGRCGHLMYSAQAENTPAAMIQNTGFCSACSPKCSQLPTLAPISCSDFLVLRAEEDGLAEAAAEQQRLERDGADEDRRDRQRDERTDHVPALLQRRAAVMTVAMIAWA